MTYEEMKALQTKKRKPREKEHELQSACVKWFRLKYRNYQHILFAVPNGARRTAQNGARYKAEGMLAGVADLILLKSNKHFGALCIEMKTKSGTQQQTQKEWQKHAEEAGNKYVICRSLEDFRREVDNYMADI